MTRPARLALWCCLLLVIAAAALGTYQWLQSRMLEGSGVVAYDMRRGGMTSAVVHFESSFDAPPVVMITSTCVLTDVAVSVGATTATSFEIVLATSHNSSAASLEGNYTFDWVAIAR